MKFIDKIILKYIEFKKKRMLFAQEKKVNAEAKWKKYCLSTYGVYHNADKLTREEMLPVFWKMLKENGYDTSNFCGNTGIHEPGKQSWDWRDLGCVGFIMDLEEVFGLQEKSIADIEYKQIQTFDELADFIIKKAKEKKLK